MIGQAWSLWYHARSLQEAVQLLVEKHTSVALALIPRTEGQSLAWTRGYLWAQLRRRLRPAVGEVLESFPELGAWAAEPVLEQSTEQLIQRAIAHRVARTAAPRRHAA